MRISRRTFRSGLALVALACALVAYPSVATAQSTPSQDLRSPDARDAGLTPITQDLRSPDTRDAADGYRPSSPSSTRNVPLTLTSQTASAGFDWVDALVGAAATLGVMLLTVAGVLLARRHSHHDRPAAA